MVYMGTLGFRVCTQCTRMHNNRECPECGSTATRPFRETTAAERKRWEAKKHFADPEREK